MPYSGAWFDLHSQHSQQEIEELWEEGGFLGKPIKTFAEVFEEIPLDEVPEHEDDDFSDMHPAARLALGALRSWAVPKGVRHADFVKYNNLVKDALKQSNEEAVLIDRRVGQLYLMIERFLFWTGLQQKDRFDEHGKAKPRKPENAEEREAREKEKEAFEQRMEELRSYAERLNLDIVDFGRRHQKVRPAKIASPPIGNQAKYASNHFTGTAVAALAKLPWLPTDQPGYAYGTTEERKDFKVFFGIPDGKVSEPLLSVFARGGVPMVKAYYALWARWYASGGKPRGYVTVDLNQFCDDLGYKRHHNGGHKIERKQNAVECVRALTTVEMQATWSVPNGKKGKKNLRLSGQIWQRGVLAEQQDEYADLFGAAREGDPNLWEPIAFRFTPGDWFSDEDFCKYANAVGQIGAGLLHLDNHIDSWPILIGGYLGTVMRANQYAPLRILAETILHRASLAQSPDERRRSTQFCQKFERAMDRLREVGVIAEWTWDGIDATEPDLDDPAALAAYGADEAPSLARNSWRNQMVKIILPIEREADRKRLQERQKTAVASSKRSAARLTRQREAKSANDASG